MEPGHRTEEIHARNAHRRRKRRRQCVDEADSHVVAVDGVAPVCSLAVWSRDESRRGALGVEQGGGKAGRIADLGIVTMLLEINGLH
jgi:hypothetical protein